MDRRDYAGGLGKIINDVNEYLVEQEGLPRLVTHKEVCGSCWGEGKYVNPSIDSHGISPDEFYDDPDFEEAYFSGAYDIRCQECKGNNVVDAVDRERTNPESLKHYDEWIRSMYEMYADMEAERRAGC